MDNLSRFFLLKINVQVPLICLILRKFILFHELFTPRCWSPSVQLLLNGVDWAWVIKLSFRQRWALPNFRVRHIRFRFVLDPFESSLIVKFLNTAVCTTEIRLLPLFAPDKHERGVWVSHIHWGIETDLGLWLVLRVKQTWVELLHCRFSCSGYDEIHTFHS